MRISDWSSDVCSSDLIAADQHPVRVEVQRIGLGRDPVERGGAFLERDGEFAFGRQAVIDAEHRDPGARGIFAHKRSEEHTSELQSLMRISYAVFCLKKKKDNQPIANHTKASHKQRN